MPIQFIKNPHHFQVPSKWQVVSQGQDRTIEKNGQRFKVLCEAKLSDSIFSKRRTEAILKIIFTLGIAYFCSNKVKSYLKQKECTFITSIPEEERPVAVTKVQGVASESPLFSQYQLIRDLGTFAPVTRVFFKEASDEKLKEFIDSACRDVHQLVLLIKSLKEEDIPRLVSVVKDNIPSFVEALLLTKRYSLMEPLILPLYLCNPSLELWKEIKNNPYFNILSFEVFQDAFSDELELINRIQSLDEESRKIELGGYRYYKQVMKKQDSGESVLNTDEIVPLNPIDYWKASESLKLNKLLKELEENPENISRLTVNDYRLFNHLETVSWLKCFFFKHANDPKLKELVDFTCQDNDEEPYLKFFVESLKEEDIPRFVSVVKDNIPDFVNSLKREFIRFPQVESLIIALYELDSSLEIWEECKNADDYYGALVVAAEILQILENLSPEELQKQLETLYPEILRTQLEVNSSKGKTFNRIFKALFPRLILRNIEEKKLQIMTRFFLDNGFQLHSLSNYIIKYQSISRGPYLKEMMQYIMDNQIEAPLIKRALTQLFYVASNENKALEFIRTIQSLDKDHQGFYFGALRDYMQKTKQEEFWEKVLQECGLNIGDYAHLNVDDFQSPSFVAKD